MDTLRLIRTFIKVNVQMSLAYRSEAVIEFLLDLMWLGWELLSLQIIFGNTQSLGGWSKGDLIALMGVLLMVNTFMSALIWPNTDFFNAAMHDGSLDYMLLQPVNNLFLVTFSRISIWRIVDLIVAIILIVIGVRMAGDIVTPFNLATFLLLIVSGSLVLYSLWIVLIAFTFWFTKFDNNVTILQALTDTGRYPITVYPWWLRNHRHVHYSNWLGNHDTRPSTARRIESTTSVYIFLRKHHHFTGCITGMETRDKTL